MLQKIYVHHYYSKPLFYKLAHNTIDRRYKLKDNVGSIFCTYKSINLEFIFNPELNDNEDGIHIIDFLTINYQLYINSDYANIQCVNTEQDQTAHRGGGPFGVNDIQIMKWIADTLENKKNWIILLLRTEKSYIQYDMPSYWQIMDLENQIARCKNHHIVSDTIFINDIIESKYPNHHFALTNTIHQWNELLSIRWYYEFSNIFEKLNQPYDLCFSMRYHKKNRVRIIKKLANLKNNRIFLSRTNNCKNKEFYIENTEFNKYDNINYNVFDGDDFADISWIENVEHYLEYLMRILPMSKMHILSESWDWYNGEMTSNYLSEKTYGFVLAKIPFISTHTYPLKILQKILDIDEHPFYSEIKNCIGNEDKFVFFVENFLKDFNTNYKLCKDWVDNCHYKFMKKINNDNSLLDMIQNKLLITPPPALKNKLNLL